MDKGTHDILREGPMTYIWSEHFAHTVNQTLKLNIGAEDFVIIGAHFLHPIYNIYRRREVTRQILPEMPEEGKVSLELMIRFLEIDMDVFQRETLPFLVETGAKVLVISSEGHFDVERLGEKAIRQNWSKKEADIMQEFYNKKMKEMLEKTGHLDHGNFSKRIGFLENNQVTGITPDLKFGLYPDNIHKILHAKSQTFAVPDSLRIDSDLVLNYFCNKQNL